LHIKESFLNDIELVREDIESLPLPEEEESKGSLHIDDDIALEGKRSFAQLKKNEENAASIIST